MSCLRCRVDESLGLLPVFCLCALVRSSANATSAKVVDVVNRKQAITFETFTTADQEPNTTVTRRRVALGRRTDCSCHPQRRSGMYTVLEYNMYEYNMHTCCSCARSSAESCSQLAALRDAFDRCSIPQERFNLAGAVGGGMVATGRFVPLHRHSCLGLT